MDNLFTNVLRQAKETNTACAAINILNYTTTRSIVAAAEKAGRNVILQPSTSTVKVYGAEPIRDMVNILRKNSKVTVTLHLDHCKDASIARECVDLGWDSVMMDYSALPFDENVRLTKEMVDYAHERGVAVEGEIGIISGVEDEISVERGNYANAEDVERFVQLTQVDAVAPAIGTAHGVYKSVPRINFDLVEQLSSLDSYIVVHGGTGLSEGTFIRLVCCGAVKINISTALKQVYLSSSKHFLEEKIAPVDFDIKVFDACKKEMEKYIRLFAKENVVL